MSAKELTFFFVSVMLTFAVAISVVIAVSAYCRF